MATVAPSLRISPADHGRIMTLEEFREAEELDGYRYELARGVLEVTEVPNDPHGVVVANLYDAISRYRRDHPGVILRYGGGSEIRLWRNNWRVIARLSSATAKSSKVQSSCFI